MSTSTLSQITWPRLGLRRLVIVALIGVLLGAFLLSLALGSVRIPLGDVVQILLGEAPTKATWATIVLNFRLPKALTAILAGGALAVSGLQMQTLFRNPLADPYILGVSSGASLGVALVMLSTGAAATKVVGSLGLYGDLGLIIAASLGAALIMGLVLLAARWVQSMLTLLILGLMVGYLASALVSLLIYFSLPERIQTFSLWGAGSFGGVTWGQLQVFAPIILIGLTIAHFLSKSLNALLLGDTYAKSMGVNVQQTRRWIIVSAALLAGATTAFCGPIGFLGVAVPHLCRTIFNTADHRVLIPTSLLLGAAVALLADLIAQLPGSQTVLPINVITSLFGVPVILWMLLRQQQLRSTFAG
ncbi:MAG: iron ABC transporter permease [Caldilineaceae bacterium]|nr:iron ABC transporter permease [Caldilineaceae bacterium]MCB0142422.1 iron ABC transporter permease [Caldilineaceae bacterium]